MASPASQASAFTFETYSEDPSSYLPRGSVLVYDKKRLIYGQDRSSAGLYRILEGRVKVSRAVGGDEVVVDIYRAGDFFGESALVGQAQQPEEATALEDTKVASWTTTEIETLVAHQPRLAVALWRILVQRTVDLSERIESFSKDTVAQRLARCLIRLSERLGTPTGDGAIQMPALTHRLLAGYVGTSREIVSHDMSDFRRRGYVRYSRKSITLYRDSFQEWLREGA